VLVSAVDKWHLVAPAEHLSPRQWTRLSRMLDNHDPTNEIGGAWAVNERLRLLLTEQEPSKIRRRLADFYDAAIDAQLPEATRLAETIQTSRATSASPPTKSPMLARGTPTFNRSSSIRSTSPSPDTHTMEDVVVAPRPAHRRHGPQRRSSPGMRTPTPCADVSPRAATPRHSVGNRRPGFDVL
jgi:hypothetical protein